MEKKENKNWPVRAIYTVFLAILIALFFGLGVAAFYKAPERPEITSPAIEKEETDQSRAEIIKYETQQNEYQEKIEAYNRNVSMITLGLALFAVVVGLLLTNKILLISDGLMLGGVFTLVYSIIRGMQTEDAIFRFVVASAGLLITVGLGYVKFIRNREEK